MSYEVGVTARFHASHALRGDFGPATLPHEHHYRVDVAVRGERLRQDGTLLDLALLERSVRRVLSPLEGASLDALPAFQQRNSTAEEVARHVALELGTGLGADGVTALRVRVWESDSAYASCEQDLR